MFKNCLYLVTIFLSVIFPSNQASPSVSNVEINNNNLYALNDQFILITFDSNDISINKIYAQISRDSITDITGSCYDVIDKKNQANCTFDLGTVTPNENYKLIIKYDNIKKFEASYRIEFGFICFPLANYFDNKISQNTIIICNKEVATTSTISLKKESERDISGICSRFKEDGRKLNCTFDCSSVTGGSIYSLKVNYGGENVNAPEITIGKSGETFIKMTSTMIIVLIMILL
jgi:hypothetical protein